MIQGGMVPATRRVISLREGTRMQESTIGHCALVRLEAHAQLSHFAILQYFCNPLRARLAPFCLEFGLPFSPAFVVCAFHPCALRKRHCLWLRKAGTELQQTWKFMSDVRELVQGVIHGPRFIQHQFSHLLPNMSISCLTL